MSQIPPDYREMLECFLENKRSKLLIELERAESLGNPVSTVNSYKTEIQLTYELIGGIERCRKFIETATVRSGRPKILRSGFIKVNNFFFSPKISLEGSGLIARVSQINGYENNLRSMVNTSRYERYSTYNNNVVNVTDREVIPGVLISIVYPSADWSNPIRIWDHDSDGLIFRSIFHNLDEVYDLIENKVFEYLQDQIEQVKEILNLEVSNPNGKIRKSFREKLTRFLSSKYRDVDVTIEQLETIFSMDPDNLEDIAKWVRRNQKDLSFVNPDDIRVSIDQANVISILKS